MYTKHQPRTIAAPVLTLVLAASLLANVTLGVATLAASGHLSIARSHSAEVDHSSVGYQPAVTSARHTNESTITGTQSGVAFSQAAEHADQVAELKAAAAARATATQRANVIDAWWIARFLSAPATEGVHFYYSGPGPQDGGSDR